MSAADLDQMGALYRQATDDLALARRDFPEHNVSRYLNQLVQQGYARIYVSDNGGLPTLRRFYGRDLPRLFRRLLRYVALAAFLFYGSALAMFVAIQADPNAASLVIDPRTEDDIRNQRAWWRDLNGQNQTGAATIMTHNLRVAAMAFAGGLSAGAFTVYVAISNGFSLGAVFGLSFAAGNPWPLAEFVIGHGVLELNEIIFAVASGLLMGHAILQPGLHSRKTALAIAAGDAIRLMLGTAPVLVVAGLVEGLVSPRPEIPAILKVSFGLLSGIALYGYLLLSGKPERRA